MTEFDKAWEFTRLAEGLDKPYIDPKAGFTRWGISQRLLDQLGITQFSAKNITEEQAKKVAESTFWEMYRYAEIDSQPVATRIFDLTFLHGPKGSHIAAQRAWNATYRSAQLIGARSFGDGALLLVEDGILGRLTLRAINWACNDPCYEEGYLAALIAAQCGRLEDIDDEKHERGWINRVLGRT